MHLLPFIMSNEYIRDIANYFHEWSAINMTGILNGGGGGVYCRFGFPWGL